MLTEIAHWFVEVWHTQDGQFLLVGVPFCAVFAGLLAAAN